MNIIPKPNFTQVPNILLDSMAEFTHTEFKVLMFVCRHTFGWQREKKKMSFSYVMEGCGLSREAVNNAFVTLLSKGVLQRSESGNSFEYSLNVDEVEQKTVRETDQFAKQTDIGSPNRPICQKSVRQTDTKKERGVNKELNKGVVIPLLLQTSAFQEAWARWNDHLRQKRKPATSHALDLQLKKLEGWGEKRAIAAINNSIMGNWQGIFEEKTNANGFQKPPLASKPPGGNL